MCHDQVILEMSRLRLWPIEDCTNRRSLPQLQGFLLVEKGENRERKEKKSMLELSKVSPDWSLAS